MSPDPSKVIFISDTHRGAKVSNFSTYEEQLLERMQGSGHIVLIGDIFELLYFKKQKGIKPKNYVKGQIQDSIAWLKDFMDKNPECKVHFILGNHENIRKFRNSLDRLQADEKYSRQFEWSPEAIRLGDALITHGHLQIDTEMPDSENDPYRLRHAHEEGRWTGIYARVEKPGQAVVDRLRKQENIVPHMDKLLREWATWPPEANWFSYIHNGEKHPFTTMDWVGNVFFGHTHVKFHNHEYNGILYHNTGAFTHVKSSKPELLGVLEAELSDDKILNVREVQLVRSRSR